MEDVNSAPQEKVIAPHARGLELHARCTHGAHKLHTSCMQYNHNHIASAHPQGLVEALSDLAELLLVAARLRDDKQMAACR